MTMFHKSNYLENNEKCVCEIGESEKKRVNIVKTSLKKD